MLKLFAACIWIILVTAGSTLTSFYIGIDLSGSKEDTEHDAGVEELTSEMSSVPIMRDGNVMGYLIFQLSFVADRALLEEKKLDPMPFMTDAAFRVVFTGRDIDFRDLRKNDLDRLTAEVLKEANARIGFDLVRSVLLKQFNFVKKEDIRTNWIGSGDNSGE